MPGRITRSSFVLLPPFHSTRVVLTGYCELADDRRSPPLVPQSLGRYLATNRLWSSRYLSQLTSIIIIWGVLTRRIRFVRAFPPIGYLRYVTKGHLATSFSTSTSVIPIRYSSGINPRRLLRLGILISSFRRSLYSNYSVEDFTIRRETLVIDGDASRVLNTLRTAGKGSQNRVFLYER